MTPTYREPDRSAQDLPFEIAEDRVAGLRASAALHASLAPRPGTPVATGPGPLDRSRDALGRRLIALGAALVVDEGLRRRALRP